MCFKMEFFRFLYFTHDIVLYNTGACIVHFAFKFQFVLL